MQRTLSASMRLLLGLGVAVVGMAAFFAWANRGTRRNHAGFTPHDVQFAIENRLGRNDPHLDEWDLFLGWPIDDPGLESIRQRCIRLSDEFSREEQLVPRLEEILAELQDRK